jgi:hypothetical protein
VKILAYQFIVSHLLQYFQLKHTVYIEDLYDIYLLYALYCIFPCCVGQKNFPLLKNVKFKYAEKKVQFSPLENIMNILFSPETFRFPSESLKRELAGFGKCCAGYISAANSQM